MYVYVCVCVCMYIYIYIYLCVLLQTDESQWHIVFYIASAVYFTFNLFFVVFAKAEIQPWNYTDAPSKWMQPNMYTIIPVRMQAIFVISSSNISVCLYHRHLARNITHLLFDSLKLDKNIFNF
jgi:hypothetical protein